jgi:hypothetical protein
MKNQKSEVVTERVRVDQVERVTLTVAFLLGLLVAIGCFMLLNIVQTLLIRLSNYSRLAV